MSKKFCKNNWSTIKKWCSIDLIFGKLILALTVIVVLIFRIVLFVHRTVFATRLVDAVIDTSVANAFATTVVEPAITRGTHTLASLSTFVPRIALSHVSYRAIDRHYVWFQWVVLFCVWIFWNCDFFAQLRKWAFLRIIASSWIKKCMIGDTYACDTWFPCLVWVKKGWCQNLRDK